MTKKERRRERKRQKRLRSREAAQREQDQRQAAAGQNAADAVDSPSVASSKAAPYKVSKGQIKPAGPSELFPDFPLHPQNLFRAGEPIRGQSLADVSEVGVCICAEFEAWRESSQGRWPSYADRELTALARSFGRMKADVPPGIATAVDIAEIQSLIREFVQRIRADERAYAQFMSGNWTLYNTTIDFGNTIACGGTLQAALSWYQ